MSGRNWTPPLFAAVVLALAVIGVSLFSLVMDGAGWTAGEVLLMAVFIPLFTYLAFGFAHALTGILLRWGDDRDILFPEETGEGDPEGRVAVVMPVYNESVDRVFAGLKATFRSLLDLPEGRHFDVHILSDSTVAGQWIAEEAAWLEWVRGEGLEGRVFYRHRSDNTGKKAGNVAEFCRRCGAAYEAMVVLDADSVMDGATLVELRRRLVANHRIALIQTVPALVGAKTLFGRLQQFANRLYGPVFMDGLAFWQQHHGNFWGHNAIIRLAPFMEECALPELPGPEPFGGPILSHDFVEAGLLVRAGWEVWLAPDLGGSYEEGPPSIVDAAQRDRRWCQGNLQHAILLAARGMRGRTRLHFLNGILGYLSSPLWLLLTVLGLLVLGSQEAGDVAASGKLLGLTAALLFLPKLLCVVDLLTDRRRCEGFGGIGNALAGAAFETAVSALIAPVNMLFHTRYVIWNLMGRKVAWDAQNRDSIGTTWADAWKVHRGHVASGALLAVLAAWSGGAAGLLLASPIIVGLLASVWVSVATSRPVRLPGGWLMTPEEADRPGVLEGVLDAKPRSGARPGLVELMLDPTLNAAHLALLPQGEPESGRLTGETEERLIREGPDALDATEAMALLASPAVLERVHAELWRRPNEALPRVWRDKRMHLMNEAHRISREARAG